VRLHTDSLVRATSDSLAPLDTRSPHVVSRRYGELVASLLVINSLYPTPTLRILDWLSHFQKEFLSLLERLSPQMDQYGGSFLLAQLDVVCTLFSQRRVKEAVPAAFW